MLVAHRVGIRVVLSLAVALASPLSTPMLRRGCRATRPPAQAQACRSACCSALRPRRLLDPPRYCHALPPVPGRAEGPGKGAPSCTQPACSLQPEFYCWHAAPAAATSAKQNASAHNAPRPAQLNFQLAPVGVPFWCVQQSTASSTAALHAMPQG